ncbi:MAG: DUF5615 family PIN-like protein [Bacteroidota bacterium]
MKLFIDENISYRILKKLINYFPESTHATKSGLKQPSKDTQIWNFSKKNNFTILTFDDDFEDLSNLLGFPPKVILMRTGNSSTNFVSNILIEKLNEIQTFIQSENYGVFEIY